MVKYGIQLLEVCERERLERYHIPIKTCDRTKQWRAFQQAASNRMYNSCTILAEELNLRIYGTYELKHLHIPIKGRCFTDVNIVEHYKQIKVIWSKIEVGDHGIQIKEEDLMGKEDFALDDISILNIENSMDV